MVSFESSKNNNLCANSSNEQAMNIDTNGREKEIHRCVTCVQEEFYCLSKKHRYGQFVNYVIIRNERTNYKLL